MARRDEREIVRSLEGEELEQSLPCWVGHGEGLDPCKQPSVVRVYGLPFCEVHGEEIRAGAMEEMVQEADEFFRRMDSPEVPEFTNELILRIVRTWGLLLETRERVTDEETETALLRAYPFRADRVIMDLVGEMVEDDRDYAPPYDSLRDERHEIHGLMRHAYTSGLLYVVEALEKDRERVASQCAYMLALSRGEHPEVLERARREMAESNRKVAERLGK
jgi:hypothetical protein